MLAHLQAGELAQINFRDFRVAGAMKDGMRSSMLEFAERNDYQRHMKAGETQAACDSAIKALERNAASASNQFDAMQSARMLNKEPEAAEHEKIMNALLDSIENDGDGKTPETAYLAVTTPEEYILLLLRLKHTATKQSLITQHGHGYDKLDYATESGDTASVWFQIDVQMGAGFKAAGTGDEPKVLASAERGAQTAEQIGKQAGQQTGKEDRKQTGKQAGEPADKQAGKPAGESGNSGNHEAADVQTRRAASMHILVARSDAGDHYDFTVDFQLPAKLSDLPASAAMDHFDTISLYGFRMTDTEKKSMKQRFPTQHGSWSPGDAVQLKFQLPKENSDPEQGWHMHFCAGVARQCIPSPNLLDPVP